MILLSAMFKGSIKQIQIPIVHPIVNCDLLLSRVVKYDCKWHCYKRLDSLFSECTPLCLLIEFTTVLLCTVF